MRPAQSSETESQAHGAEGAPVGALATGLCAWARRASLLLPRALVSKGDGPEVVPVGNGEPGAPKAGRALRDSPIRPELTEELRRERRFPRVTNFVIKARFNCVMHQPYVALHVPYAEHVPLSLPAVKIRLANSICNSTCLLFHSGYMILTGARTFYTALRDAFLYTFLLMEVPQPVAQHAAPGRSLRNPGDPLPTLRTEPLGARLRLCSVAIENLVTTGVLFGHSLSLNEIQRAYPEQSSYNPRNFAGLNFVVTSKQCPELTTLLPAKKEGPSRNSSSQSQRGASPSPSVPTKSKPAKDASMETPQALRNRRKRDRQTRDHRHQPPEESQAKEHQGDNHEKEPQEEKRENRADEEEDEETVPLPDFLTTVANTKPPSRRSQVGEIMFGDRIVGQDPSHLLRALGTSIFDSGSCNTIGKSTVAASRVVYRYLVRIFHRYEDHTRPTRREHIHRYRLQQFQAEQRRKEARLAAFDISRQLAPTPAPSPSPGGRTIPTPEPSPSSAAGTGATAAARRPRSSEQLLGLSKRQPGANPGDTLVYSNDQLAASQEKQEEEEEEQEEAASGTDGAAESLDLVHLMDLDLNGPNSLDFSDLRLDGDEVGGAGEDGGESSAEDAFWEDLYS